MGVLISTGTGTDTLLELAAFRRDDEDEQNDALLRDRALAELSDEDESDELAIDEALLVKLIKD